MNYQIWYPDPDGIGTFIHTTFGDPIKVSHEPFLLDAPCGKTILYNISYSFSGGSFSQTLPPFMTYDKSLREIKINNTDDRYSGIYQVRVNVYVIQSGYSGPENFTYFNLTILDSWTLNPGFPEFIGEMPEFLMQANTT